MGFFQNAKRWWLSSFGAGANQKAHQQVTATSGSYNYSLWPGGIFGPQSATLESNEEIFSVVTRLANTVSSLPIHLYQQYKETSNSVSDLLTTEPNPSMTAFSLLNQLETSRNSAGNGYLWIERGKSGQPVHLWPIDPSSVIVKKNVDDHSIWYEVSNNEYQFLVYNTEIIHVRHITPLSNILGISPIDVLKGPISFARSVEEFSLNEMQKKDAYIIKYDRSVSPEKRQAIIEDFAHMIKENGGAVVQEKGFEYERFQSNFQPSDLKTVESITRARIANAFNVPLAFLNEATGGNATSSMSEQTMIQFVQMALIPIVKQYEAEFNRKLLTSEQRRKGYYFKFNVNGLMRGDTTSRTAFYQMMLRNGIASPNDLRKLEDLPIVDEPNADKLWFSGDLYPIDMAGQRQPSNNNLVDQPPSKGGENDDEEPDSQVSDDQATS